MKKLLIHLSILSLLAVLTLPMIACAPKEEAGVEADDMGDAADEAMDEAGEEMDEAGEAMDEGMEEMGEDMEEMGEDMEEGMGDETMEEEPMPEPPPAQ
jgi:hypothetical protein